MQFSNARRGVHLIFVAAILKLIAEVLAGVVLGVSDAAYDGGAAAIIVIVGTVASLVLLIIALVQYLRGMTLAARDEGNFFTGALALVIVTIVVAVLEVIFNLIPSVSFTVGTSFNFVTDIFEVMITLFIIDGIVNLFSLKNDSEMVHKGSNTGIFFAAAFILSKAIELFYKSSLLQNGFNFEAAACIIFAVLYVVLAVIAYVKFILFLNKAQAKL